MNKKNHEQMFAELLQNDQVGEPKLSVEDRLMYSFLLKNSQSKVKQNSFVHFFGWLFSLQGMGLKAGLVSVVLVFSLMNKQFTFESSKVIGSDSISNERILLADTAHYIQTVDSIRKDSLY
ncbi:MAG TPA: hypothetical protein VFC65_03710 [Prolixibacteraceae bacterium]|nr:hypothetical protein [Prolixibacteraceae bacterium]